MQTQVILRWEGPYRFRDFVLSPESKYHVAGIYLWVSKNSNPNIIYYIGKATGKPSLLTRQQQHYACYVGGLYYLPGSVRASNKEWTPGLYPDNAETILHEDRFVELVKDGMRFANELEIYLAPLPGIDSKKLALIERNLLYKYKPSGTTQGTKTEPKVMMDIGHENLSLDSLFQTKA